MQKTNNIHTVLEDIPKYFILGGLLATVIFFLWLIKPFIPIIIVASVIAIGFYPLNRVFLKFFKMKTLSSVLTTIIVLSIVLVPVILFVSYITKEAVETYVYLELKFADISSLDIRLLPQIIENSFVGKYLDGMKNIFPIHAEDFINFLSSSLQSFSQYLVNKTTLFAKQMSVVVFQLFVLLLSVFFFFRDGDRILNEIKILLPIAKEHKDQLFQKLYDMSRGILYGVFGASIIQGFLGGIGFAIVGIENAAFWGTIIALFSIIPYIGSTVIWIPAAIFLLVSGHVFAGTFLILWGALIVGTIDNFIKPFIIGEKAHVHPLLSFISILGGFFTMGISGLVVAPYILSLALSFIHIYKLEYKKVLGK